MVPGRVRGVRPGAVAGGAGSAVPRRAGGAPSAAGGTPVASECPAWPGAGRSFFPGAVLGAPHGVGGPGRRARRFFLWGRSPVVRDGRRA